MQWPGWVRVAREHRGRARSPRRPCHRRLHRAVGPSSPRRSRSHSVRQAVCSLRFRLQLPVWALALLRSWRRRRRPIPPRRRRRGALRPWKPSSGTITPSPGRPRRLTPLLRGRRWPVRVCDVRLTRHAGAWPLVETATRLAPCCLTHPQGSEHVRPPGLVAGRKPRMATRLVKQLLVALPMPPPPRLHAMRIEAIDPPARSPRGTTVVKVPTGHFLGEPAREMAVQCPPSRSLPRHPRPRSPER